jgi:hypothetical protein
MIPSGYKSGKIYSQKPLSTDGQLTFTRASDATRVASNGLIEKVRTNLVLQSQTFDNASWTKTTDGQVTITANAAVAPDGTTTAEKMIPSAIAGFHCVQQGVSISASEVSVSIFAKAAEYSFLQIFDSLTTEFANFNLTTGVVGSTNTYVASIESVGNGWYRCKATKAAPSGSFTLRYGVVTSGTAVRGESFTGNGTDGLLIWGAQAETGVTTDYIATTTAAVSVGPVSGLPRLDYLGSTCPRLLLEPQRSNLLTFSEQFDNAAWTKQTGITITANTTETLDPSGYYGADKVVSTSGSTGFFQSGLSLTSDITRTIYLKGAVGGETLKLKDPSGFGGNTSVTLTTSWVRYEHKTTNTGDTYQGLFVDDISNGATIYAWGCQLEASSSYATSYIPTLGASVTRVADACSKTGISSLIGQTEGTIFAEVDFDAAVNTEGYIFRIDQSSFNDTVYVSRGGDKILTGGLRAGGSNIVQLQKTAFNGVNKLAFAYKSGSFALYVNGTQVATSAATYTNGITYDDIRIGGFSATTANMSGGISQMLLFKTRLTNAQLAELTSL